MKNNKLALLGVSIFIVLIGLAKVSAENIGLKVCVRENGAIYAFGKEFKKSDCKKDGEVFNLPTLENPPLQMFDSNNKLIGNVINISTVDGATGNALVLEKETKKLITVDNDDKFSSVIRGGGGGPKFGYTGLNCTGDYYFVNNDQDPNKRWFNFIFLAPNSNLIYLSQDGISEEFVMNSSADLSKTSWPGLENCFEESGVTVVGIKPTVFDATEYQAPFQMR